MSKYLKQGFIRKLEWKHSRGEISYSNMIDLIEQECIKNIINDWISLREKSKDEFGEKLCYCGHTDKCSCSNPDEKLFRESVKNGTIILTDKNNGWKNVQK